SPNACAPAAAIPRLRFAIGWPPPTPPLRGSRWRWWAICLPARACSPAKPARCKTPSAPSGCWSFWPPAVATTGFRGAGTAARLAAKEAPKHPDTEQTIDELHARIRTVVAYLETFKEEDFAAADTRVVPLSFMPGKGMLAHDYVFEMQTPNFFFHVTHAYAI